MTPPTPPAITAPQLYQRLAEIINEWQEFMNQIGDWQTSDLPEVPLQNPNGIDVPHIPLPRLLNDLDSIRALGRGVLYYSEPEQRWDRYTTVDQVDPVAVVNIPQTGEVLISLYLDDASYATVLSVDDVQIADFGDRDVDVKWWHFPVSLSAGEHTIKVWSYRGDTGVVRKILVTGEGGERVNPGDRTQLKLSALKHFDRSELRDLPLNGGQQSSGTFQLTAKEEMYQVLNGQNSGSDSANPVPSILGEAYFAMPTEDATGLCHSPHPLLGSRYIPIPFIKTTIFNQPTDVPLFEAVRVSEYGMSTFRYIGEQPLYTVLKGGLSVLRRVAGTYESSVQMWLRLRPLSGLPNWEKGQNSGIQNLAVSCASGDEVFELSGNEFNDLMGRPTQGTIDRSAKMPELNLLPPHLSKYISASSSDLQDPRDPVTNLPAPGKYPNFKTTDWFPVEKGQPHLIQVIGGTSSRRRVQIKDAEGVIHQAPEISRNSSAEGFIRFPINAVQARIYFSGSSDDAENLSVKHVPYSVLRSHDVLGGKWTRKQFQVNKDVVFYPGVEYGLYWGSYWSSEPSGGQDYGYRYESGGFSCLFDATKVLKNKMKQFTKG